MQPPAPPYPPQHQDRQPGAEAQMNPLPIFDNPNYV
ncbi:NAD(P)-dependent oxidoreductase, partial [Cohnella sp. CBP 2801]|nr:NAD(P)-dependent oxidoreductase [Cohnella zeiphila]